MNAARFEFRRHPLAWAIACGLGLHGAAQAQLVINDTLTGASSSFNWKPLNGACLTAGDNTGTIPACSGLAYYTSRSSVLVGGTSGRLPDVPGQGALRLTNGDYAAGTNSNDQTGAVVSNFTFPTNEGLQVTFTAVTYGGNKYNNSGADGISFFLSDGSYAPSVGARGGSIGYSCSNGNLIAADGVIGAYIGVGIDEYGNFSNPGDNTDTGPGFQAGRISVRGAGSTAYAWLNANYPSYYPANLSNQLDAVHNTCKTGYLWNYSSGSGRQTTQKLAFNYPLLTYSTLPGTVQISNQEAVAQPTRGAAVPFTYSLKLTQDGLLDFSYSVNGGTAQQVISGQRITASNGPLPSSFRFGFSAGTGGGTNVHEITCFKAEQVSQSNSSASTSVQQTARVQAGSQVYLALFHPTNWWGQLTAQSLLYDPVADALTVSTLANWDAHCVLTGGVCTATGGTNAVTAQAPAARSVLTWNGSAGIPFQWANLTAAQKSSLTAGDATSTDLRLRYLRGDRTTEVANGGTLRTRSGVLGDIVDSSPVWVGPPASPYSTRWVDKLNASATPPEGTSYTSFIASYGTRLNTVYVGANDGLLHGFRAGSFASDGTTFVDNGTTPNDGKEVLAYMPGEVVSSIHSATPSLDFPSTQYSHNFFADATVGTGDLYYSGSWHTWLVSGLGPGGHSTGPVNDPTAASTGALFALDVTNPANFSETNAAATVLGEWSSATLSCVGTASCGNYLGQLYGTPAVRRLHNGNWAVLFGNGLNSANGTAGLFIMLVDASGGRTFRYIDTGYGTARDPQGAGNRNGLTHVTPADLDGDHITDYVYAGDLFGNVWRFDLTDPNPGNWSVGATPLFSTPAGQPISTKVVVGSVPGATGTSRPKVVVAFGTGQKLPQTLTNAATYATGSQTLYGIWDWNMASWNAKSSATPYDSLTAPQTVNTSKLRTQTVTSTQPGSGNVSGYRTVSSSVVCWSGSTSCAAGQNTQFGWQLTLPLSTEQVVYSPIIAYNMFLVNTTVPPTSNPLTCGVTPSSGYTMALSLGSGGAAAQSFFPNASGNFVTYNGNVVAGIGLNATGSPSVMVGGQKPYLVQQTLTGQAVTTKINPTGGTGSRLNWTKTR